METLRQLVYEPADCNLGRLVLAGFEYLFLKTGSIPLSLHPVILFLPFVTVLQEEGNHLLQQFP